MGAKETAAELVAVPELAGKDLDGEVGALLERLRTSNVPLAPHLVEVLPRDGTVWLRLGTKASRPVSELLARPETNVAQRVPMVLDLVAAVDLIERSDVGHHRLSEECLRMDGEGRLCIAPVEFALAPPSDLAQALSDAGRLACWLLGVSPSPNGELAIAERQAPALAAAARSLAARGETNSASVVAQLEEAAGQLASHSELIHSRHLLAGTLDTGQSGARPVGTGRARPEPTRPAGSIRRGSSLPEPSIRVRPNRLRTGLLVLGALLAGFVAMVLPIVLLARAVGLHAPSLQGTLPAAASPRPAAQGQPSAPPAPAPTPAATPLPSPSAVTQVLMAPQGTCQPGRSCSVRVDVSLQPPNGTTEVIWAFTVTDACRGTSAEQAGPSVTAQAGWTYVYGISSVDLPSTGKVSVVAHSTAPGQGSSAPLTVGSGC